jgi:hypothetical protein
MAISGTSRAILAQIALFLIVHVFLYLHSSEVEVANLFYVGNLMDFLEFIPINILLAVAFDELFPGQFWVWIALPFLSVFSLWRYRRDRSQSKYIAIFHVSSATWTLLPILTSSLGEYRGP